MGRKLLLSFLTALTLAPSDALADDIFKGVRGPTTVQVDGRIVASRNEKGTVAFTQMVVGKYWDGNESGKFGFVSIPYKFVHVRNADVSGLGDITIGGGPRGSISDFNWISYGAMMLPTGGRGRIPIGTGCYNVKSGLFATYMPNDKRFDIDGSLEYNFNSHEILAGAIAGAKTSGSTRAAIGTTYFEKENSHLVNLRSVARYTVSPKLHFELMGNYGLSADNLPKANDLGLFVRYNF